MKENKTASINTRVKPSLKDRFNSLCESMGLSQSEMITELVREKEREIQIVRAARTLQKRPEQGGQHEKESI